MQKRPKENGWGRRITSNWLLKDYDRAKAISYLDWIGIALIRHRDAGILLEGENIGKFSQTVPEITEHPSHWQVNVLPKVSFEAAQSQVEAEVGDWQSAVKKGWSLPVESEYKEEVDSRLSWTYSHPLAANKMSKQSVSELKRMAEIQDESSGTELINKQRKTAL